ncbi:hypothetical protein EXIGLDRAFT_103460 [Exidia glandulosa HHB12029]|uniref:Uncharacterized protein n=1 Tax=Exidia glandulosa HHB12029 TaxID=1314781 RepID=A0A165GX30_EXIGL|nr:hypothetical protein EXIGLDRAFT_103460 [Exidia glandulosa HHB12029]
MKRPAPSPSGELREDVISDDDLEIIDVPPHDRDTRSRRPGTPKPHVGHVQGMVTHINALTEVPTHDFSKPAVKAPVKGRMKGKNDAVANANGLPVHLLEGNKADSMSLRRSSASGASSSSFSIPIIADSNDGYSMRWGSAIQSHITNKAVDLEKEEEKKRAKRTEKFGAVEKEPPRVRRASLHPSANGRAIPNNSNLNPKHGPIPLTTVCFGDTEPTLEDNEQFVLIVSHDEKTIRVLALGGAGDGRVMLSVGVHEMARLEVRFRWLPKFICVDSDAVRERDRMQQA